MRRFDVLKALVRRELLENRLGLIYAPWIVSFILCVVIVLVYSGLADISTPNFTFSTSIFDNPETVEWMRVATAEQIHAVTRTALLILGTPVVLVMFFGIVSYSLGTFYEERKDKSITFWRSLPVSDGLTILSKVFVACFVTPLIVLPALIVLHLVALLSASFFLMSSDIVSFGWVWDGSSIIDWLRVIVSLWTQAIWLLPIISWLMLSGSYAKKPIVAAILPVVALVVLERVVSSSGVLFSILKDRFGPWSLSSSFPNKTEELRVVDISDVQLLITTGEFWYGILLSIVLLAATVYVRNRSQFSSIQ
jgi:ABC-2 type transport system permease protein|tara:strand:- start:348 stop:1271 length:924 start_codon:yes stop_codon:yes gene_type:complete